MEDSENSGGIKIGSFNVLNLKTNVNNKSSQEKENFKTLRIQKIAELIKTANFAIVALQEIQSSETVEQIVAELNRDGTSWDFVHCDRVYEEVNNYSSPGQKMLEDRAELAFVFDSRKLVFIKDFAFYKGIHERFLSAIQWFISALLGVAAAGIGVDSCSKQEKEPDKTQDSRAKTIKRVVKGAGSATTGLAAVGAWFGMDKYKEKSHNQIEGFLRKTLRPPLVALFKSRSSERNVQLRFINMHSQFSYEKAPIKARQTESRFVLQHIFHIVNTQRVLSLSNLNSTAFTIAAGDFNLTKKQLDEVIRRRSVKDVEPYLAVLQTHPSTIRCTNKEEVASGKATEYKYEFTDNDYDHFVLDGKLWGTDNEPIRTKCNGVVMDLDILRPKHADNPHRKAISDHHPIVISTEQL